MELILSASKREQHGKRVRALRSQGKLPAVVYGHRQESTPLLLDGHEFQRVFSRAGRTHLVDLVLDGGRAQKVLVREVQLHPRFRGAVHVDLYRVDMREKLQADVPVHLTGESPIVKLGDADLIQMLNAVRVECLPGDIPEAFQVDVTRLENIGDVLRVRDLVVGDNLTIVTDPEEVVAKAQAMRVTVEEEPVEAAAEGEEVPVEEQEPAAEAAAPEES